MKYAKASLLALTIVSLLLLNACGFDKKDAGADKTSPLPVETPDPENSGNNTLDNELPPLELPDGDVNSDKKNELSGKGNSGGNNSDDSNTPIDNRTSSGDGDGKASGGNGFGDNDSGADNSGNQRGSDMADTGEIELPIIPIEALQPQP